MKKEKKPKIAVFVDQGNLWSSFKEMGWLIEPKNIKPFLEEYFEARVMKIFFYVAYPKEGTRNYDLTPFHKFITFLKKGLGFIIRSKPLKIINLKDKEGNFLLDDNGKIQTREKGNFDVEIAIDTVLNINEFDQMVLMSGDCDFSALIEFIQEKGKQVFVFSTFGSISKELRHGADKYFDLNKFKDELFKNDLKNREDTRPHQE